MIKKICSAILTLSMLAAATSALAYTDIKTDKQNTAAELVSGLNIMSPEDNDTFGADTLVRRGEFALYAIRTMGYTAPHSSTGGYFSDVDTTTDEGAAVDFLANIGAIPKTGNEYNPNEEVTLAEASRILLNCLGYERIASSRGGYPQGYLTTAGDTELLKNISKSTDSVLTKPDVATLLYNALFVYPMEYVNNEYKKADETLLEKTHDVYEISGVVESYGKISINNREVADNYVVINGVSYECLAPGMENYVGYEIKGYYSEVNGEGAKLVAFTEKPQRNTAWEIDAGEIESVTNSRVEYYNENSKKNIRVSENANIIYNGRYYPNYGDLNGLLSNVAEGSVKFIANDGSSTANVIIVHDVKHLLVERVDKRNGRLYLKNGTAENANPYLADVITLDPDEMDVYVYYDGKQITFDEIEEDDAITLEKTLDNEDATLYISRNVAEGEIKRLSNDTITIGDYTYDLSAYALTNYSLGTSGAWAITTDNKFLGISKASSGRNGRDYAYVLKSYIDPGPEEAYLKIYTTDGKVNTYLCDASVKINGQTKNFRQVEQLVPTSSLITFTEKDGVIKTINRPYDASSKLNYVNETDFVKNWNKSSVRYTDGIMGMSLITEDTVIFSMPRFDRNWEPDYKMLEKKDLKNRTYSDVTCYDVDRQGRAGAVVIVEDITDSVDMSNNLFFIKKMEDAIDENGEEVRRITGYEAGEEIAIDFNEDTTSVTYEDGWMNYNGNEDFDEGYRALHVGDALQYSIGNDGKVQAYRLVFNNLKTINTKGKLDYTNPEKFYEDWSATGSVTKQDFYDDLYIAYGDVQLRYMDYMVMLGLNQTDRLRYEGSSSPIQIIDYYRPFNLTNASIYVYNVNRKELELGDMEDVQKADIIFARSKKMGETNEIMVYVEK